MAGSSSPIQRIADRFGGQSAMARALKKRHGTVWGWIDRGFVPSPVIPDVIKVAATLRPPVFLEPNDFFDLSALPAPCANSAARRARAA